MLTIWIKLELLSEISQRERQILHGITSKWNLKMGKHFELRNREEKNVFQGLCPADSCFWPSYIWYGGDNCHLVSRGHGCC